MYTPVSYTHLDVYKRQTGGISSDTAAALAHAIDTARMALAPSLDLSLSLIHIFLQHGGRA